MAFPKQLSLTYEYIQTISRPNPIHTQIGEPSYYRLLFGSASDSDSNLPMKELWYQEGGLKTGPPPPPQAPAAVLARVSISESSTPQRSKANLDKTEAKRNDDDTEDENEEEYEIVEIVDWRFAATGTKIKPTVTVDNTQMRINDIEICLRWEGYPDPKDYTWEAESAVQMTAGETVWDFW